jgi:hypothetical protein
MSLSEDVEHVLPYLVIFEHMLSQTFCFPSSWHQAGSVMSNFQIKFILLQKGVYQVFSFLDPGIV